MITVGVVTIVMVVTMMMMFETTGSEVTEDILACKLAEMVIRPGENVHDVVLKW